VERAASSVHSHAINPDLKAPKKKKAAPEREDVWEPYNERASRRCSLAEIKAQVTMRGVPLGYAKTKEPLLKLWEVNSDTPDKRFVAQPALRVHSVSAAARGGSAAAVASLAAAAARISHAQQQFVGAAAAAASGGVAPAPAAPHLPFTPTPWVELQARLLAAPAPAPAAPAAPGTLNVPLQAAAPAPAPAASAATQPRKPRACSICNAIGHQKNNCPNNVKSHE